ncbi:RHS repeat-associated core domain-containing protein [Nonomuraea wenchangensis]
MRDAGGVTWMLTGKHGSTQLAVNDTTGTVSRERYLPFGQRRGADDLPFTDRGFLGKTEDASTSLTYLGARYYDPAIARFISTDPELDLRTPEWANPYSYAANNPIDLADPDGRRVDTGSRKSDATFAKTHHASGKKKTARERKIHKRRHQQYERDRIRETRKRTRDAQIRDKKDSEVKLHQRARRQELCRRDPVHCGEGTVRETDDVALITGVIGGIGGIGKTALQAAIRSGTRTAATGAVRTSGASSAANAERLRQYLSQLEKYGKAGHKTLDNGRIRFYGEIDPARRPGEMIGRRVVREWDPTTGAKRTWQETIDGSGRIRQVRPQESLTGGKKVHYRFDKEGYYTGKW